MNLAWADTLARTTRVVPHDVIGHDQAWWTAWNFDLPLLIPVAIAALLYARGLQRWTDRSRDHSHWRTASYYAGLLLLVLAFESPLDRLGEHHFSMHMVQHNVVMMIIPPLILLGAPTTPMLRAMPQGVRRGVVAPIMRSSLARRAYRFLTWPVLCVALFTLLQWAWHLMPGWYDRALNEDAIHNLQHGSFLAVSMLFWWNIIDPKPLRSRIPVPARILYFYAAMVPKHFLAAMITFASAPLYETYTRVYLYLPLSPLEDQQLAGLLMWVPFGEMINLFTAAMLFMVWWRQSNQKQQEEERLRALQEGTPPSSRVHAGTT